MSLKGVEALFEVRRSLGVLPIWVSLAHPKARCPTLGRMRGSEFIRKVRKLGRLRGIHVVFVHERGRGSHGTLYYGDRFTVVRNPKDELKTGTLHAMLTQLGLTLVDLTDL
jgi:mRNA interferase HicA